MPLGSVVIQARRGIWSGDQISSLETRSPWHVAEPEAVRVVTAQDFDGGALGTVSPHLPFGFHSLVSLFASAISAGFSRLVRRSRNSAPFLSPAVAARVYHINAWT